VRDLSLLSLHVSEDYEFIDNVGHGNGV
jgi:hypothetical protein